MSAALHPVLSACSLSPAAPPRKKTATPRGRHRNAEVSGRLSLSAEASLVADVKVLVKERGILGRDLVFLLFYHLKQGLPLPAQKARVLSLHPRVEDSPPPVAQTPGDACCDPSSPIDPPDPTPRKTLLEEATLQPATVVPDTSSLSGAAELSALSITSAHEPASLAGKEPESTANLGNQDPETTLTAAPSPARPAEGEEPPPQSDPTGWLSAMQERHRARTQEGATMIFRELEQPPIRLLPCEIEGCSQSAAGERGGKELCQEHLNILQELARVIAPEEERPRPTPPVPPPLTDCEACGNRRYRLAEADAFARALPCPVCLASCGSCGGAGWHHYEWEDRGYSSPCRCTQLAKRRNIFNSARVPALYVPHLIGPQSPPPNYAFSPPQKEASQKVDDLVREFQRGARGLILWGPVGTAKTTLLARALASLTLEKGVRASFVEWGVLLEETKETWQTREANPILPLYKVPVLALDDVGKRPVSTEWQESQLDQLLSARYQSGLTTLISTNCPPIGKGSLQERLGYRLYDRLVERCDFIHVQGQNLRPELAREANKARRPHPWRRAFKKEKP